MQTKAAALCSRFGDRALDRVPIAAPLNFLSSGNDRVFCGTIPRLPGSPPIRKAGLRATFRSQPQPAHESRRWAVVPDFVPRPRLYHRQYELEESEVDVRIRILLRIIEEHGGVLQMSSKQIGNLLGLSEAHVLRLFNLEVGRTLRSHTREVRMARAAKLLKDSLLPIKTIASSCGYTVVSNFYRDFKIVYGISPMQMRQMRMNLRMHDARSHHCGSGRFSNLSKVVDAVNGA